MKKLIVGLFAVCLFMQVSFAHVLVVTCLPATPGQSGLPASTIANLMAIPAPGYSGDGYMALPVGTTVIPITPEIIDAVGLGVGEIDSSSDWSMLAFMTPDNEVQFVLHRMGSDWTKYDVGTSQDGTNLVAIAGAVDFGSAITGAMGVSGISSPSWDGITTWIVRGMAAGLVLLSPAIYLIFIRKGLRPELDRG